MPVFDDESKGLVGELEKPAGTVDEKDIKEMERTAVEAQKDLNRRKKDKVKEILATKEKLFDRTKRTYDINIPIDELEDGTTIMMKFKARRLTHEERSKFEAIRPPDAYSDVTDEQFGKMKDQGYEVLASVIVEPKMAVDEWRQLDVAITETLIARVSLLQYETSDAILVDDLKNL